MKAAELFAATVSALAALPARPQAQHLPAVAEKVYRLGADPRGE